MLVRIISGGQTGVDQAALRAARACGLEYGGWAPLGWLTEDGSRSEFAELPTSDYPTRTRRNVMEASATILFGTLGIVRLTLRRSDARAAD
jgi:hypothetical protein